MNQRLDFLQRKNKGKQKIESYENILVNSGFEIQELEYMDLEKSDEIISQGQEVFTKVERSFELLRSTNAFIDSDLMRNVYQGLTRFNTCYVFTDDFKYCGMYRVNARRAFEAAFSIAKNDFQNTCFLLDERMKYFFTINYNDKNHINEPETFDIQLRWHAD